MTSIQQLFELPLLNRFRLIYSLLQT